MSCHVSQLCLHSTSHKLKWASNKGCAYLREILGLSHFPFFLQSITPSFGHNIIAVAVLLLAAASPHFDLHAQAHPEELFWMQGSSIPTPSLPFQDCIGSTAGDFDRDGFEDVILGYKNALFVAWNSKEGLAPFVVLTQAEGIWDWVKWDPESHTCWVQSQFPSRIQSLVFENRQIQPQSSYTGMAWEAQIVAGGGLLVTGRDGTSMELLTSEGQVYPWITDASDVLRAQALVKGQDLLVIQDKTSKSLGFSFREDNSKVWPPVT